MKTKLSPTDKTVIIRGLKIGVFLLNDLNHLSKHLLDHTSNFRVFGDITLDLTTNDKRGLLQAVRSGFIDFDDMPDLTEKIRENFFLKMMKTI